MPVVLAIMAHPDDAEILCGGTLLRLHHEHGYEVHVATCTPGDGGSAELSPEAIAATRRREGEAGAARLGGTYHCLELRDFQVVYTPENVRRAIEVMRRVNPSLVITHPRHDYMVDHEQCHLLVRMASFAFAAPNAAPGRPPEDAHTPHLYYADPLEGRDPYTGDLVEPTAWVNVSSVIDAKTQALACHASQREWLRSHHGMDEYLEAMKRHGKMRGEAIGANYAEAFVQHRGHAYPTDDRIQQIFNPDAAT